MSITVSTLLCHDHVQMAADCLSSLVRLSSSAINLAIYDDGSITGQDRDILAESIGGYRFVSRTEADEGVTDLLHACPNALDLRHRYFGALKLFDIPLMTESDTISMIDSDILFWHRFEIPWTEHNALFMTDRESNYSLRSWQKLRATNVKLPAKVNVGIVSIKKDQYDLDYLEWFVGRSLHKGIPYVLEQTAWAALGARTGCLRLSPTQIRVMRDGESDDGLVAGHFTARSRHLLPHYAELSRNADADATPVKFAAVAPGICTSAHLALYEMERLVKRASRHKAS